MLRIESRSHASTGGSDFLSRGRRQPIGGRADRVGPNRTAPRRCGTSTGGCFDLADVSASTPVRPPTRLRRSGPSAGDSGSPVVPGTKASGEYLMSLEIDAWTSWSARLSDTALRRAPQIERTVPLRDGAARRRSTGYS